MICVSGVGGGRSSPTYSDSDRDHQGHDREYLADLHSGRSQINLRCKRECYRKLSLTGMY